MSGSIYRAEIHLDGEFFATVSANTAAKAVQMMFPYLLGVDADRIDISISRRGEDEYER